MPFIRKIQPGDIEYIAQNMRIADCVEINASCGLPPLAALQKSVELSEMLWVMEADKKPVAIFGAAKGDHGGVPWLLATDEFKKYPDFLKFFPHLYFLKMKQRFGYLYNYVHVKNKTSIKWLKMCGCRIGAPIPFGVFGEDFCYFSMGDKNNV